MQMLVSIGEAKPGGMAWNDVWLDPIIHRPASDPPDALVPASVDLVTMASWRLSMNPSPP